MCRFFNNVKKYILIMYGSIISLKFALLYGRQKTQRDDSGLNFLRIIRIYFYMSMDGTVSINMSMYFLYTIY